jgi:hypothetical protein
MARALPSHLREQKQSTALVRTRALDPPQPFAMMVSDCSVRT